ncbi:hypothetical protein CsSME_00032805 [Camellia sinensis var. sinensis]
MIKFKSNMILFYIVTTIRIGKELNFSLIGKLCFMCELSVWVEWLRTILCLAAKGEQKERSLVNVTDLPNITGPFA